MKQLLLAIAVAAVALPAPAQDYSYGRIRHVEGGTTLQRASETSSEEAFRNLPFLPGDRIWTDERGRAEFQFGGGSIVRLDFRSKLDYLANEGEGGDGRVVLRVWSGSVLLRSHGGRAPELAVETPAGMVLAEGRVALRADVAYGETRISVYQGAAQIDDGRDKTKLEAGEQLFARRGQDPGRPQRLERGAADDFAMWDEDRERQYDWAAAEADERFLPEEVAPYASDLRNNGTWHFQVDLGYVWRPTVGPGWQPYTNGRWSWSPYGWTWVPNEYWAWAPSHYGRWDHSASLGWYWSPGRTWSPAWVSWSHGRDYIGWCPLGRGDRPVVKGHGVPRGSGGPSWTYARRGELGARDTGRRRSDVADDEARSQRILERSHIDRAERVAEGEARARPRNVQVRPTPGDTIQELRADPMTTIPFPVARKRYPSEEERREREGRTSVRFEQQLAQAAEQQQPTEQSGASSDAERRRREAETDRNRRQPQRDPSSLYNWIERRKAAETAAGGNQASEQQQRERSGDRERATERREGDKADRDVMRRVFGPLSNSRGRDREQGDSASGRERDRSSSSTGRERGGDEARSQPRRESPREASPSPRVEREQRPRDDGGGGAGAGASGRRKRDR